MKNPPHPGRIVRQDCLEPLNLTVSDAAKKLDISRNALSELINERRGISVQYGVQAGRTLWQLARGMARLVVRL